MHFPPGRRGACGPRRSSSVRTSGQSGRFQLADAARALETAGTELLVHGIEVPVPDADDRDIVHRIIYNELCLGVFP